MKKALFSTLLISILAFACTNNPLFNVSLKIPYTTSYSIKASDQVGDQLVLESDAASYSSFIARVKDEMEANGIGADFSARLTTLELSIPENIDLDWSVLGDVEIDFSVNGEPSTSLDGVSFPKSSGKTLQVVLPEEGISITDFLTYELAAIRITADLSEPLEENIPLSISTEVKVSGKE